MIKLLMRALSIIFWTVIIIMFLMLPPKIIGWFERKTLNIFTWSYLLDAQYLRKFEKETGIKVNLSYYESNEELLGKLAASNSGYDLIIPSDYAVDWMIKKDMLKKIDISRLSFFNRLDPKLMHNYFDPNNEYSIPYFWGVYGIIINNNYYPPVIPRDFKLIFDKKYVPQRVCMPGNAREVIMMATNYLFGDIDALLDPVKREQVKDLLIQQKEWVACYSDERPEYAITSRTCSAVLALSPDAWRVKKEYDNIEFIIPPGAVFAVIDNFVIPKDSQKEDFIYTFLEFLYSDEAIMHHSKRFGMCPPVKIKNREEDLLLCAIIGDIDNLRFFKSQVPDALFNEVWMALMAA